MLIFYREMSYGIMGSSRNSHMLIYQSTRPVKCIYFDGESAALMGTGQMDAQMLHIYGNVSGPSRGDGFRGLRDEYARATGLCDWLHEKKLGGLGWGFEGIVRMNAGFEMIWCNFTSPSLRLISHLNVTAPLLPPTDDGKDGYGVMRQAETGKASYYPLPPSPTRSDRASDPTNPVQPPNWRRDTAREPFLSSQGWEWLVSATTHYGSSGLGPGIGETRVKLITCGILNYYSPVFCSQTLARAEDEQKSLNLTAEGLWAGPGENGTRNKALAALTRRRRAHRLDSITPSDALLMKIDSERVLSDLLDDATNCSGIDWAVMTNDIVRTYAGNLPKFLKVLEKYEELPKGNQSAVRDWLKVVRDQTHAFLLPFLEYPDSADDRILGGIWSSRSELYRNTYSRCRFHHTRLLDPEVGFRLGPEESILKWAVEETSGGICSVLVGVGLAVEGLWDSEFNTLNATRVTRFLDQKAEVRRWTEEVEELMAWLGWAGEWIGCEKKCALDVSDDPLLLFWTDELMMVSDFVSGDM
jgi:hypothetical protein